MSTDHFPASGLSTSSWLRNLNPGDARLPAPGERPLSQQHNDAGSYVMCQLGRHTHTQRASSQRRVKMKELLVFLLVGCGLAQCTILTKCPLKEQLDEAIGKLGNPGLGDSLELQAKIVCYVELTSGFNTSAVTEKKVGSATWTLYGIFQLSDHLICSDGQTPSLNKCSKSCTDLLDSDISDDIDCLLETLIDLIKLGFLAPHWEEVGKMVNMILLQGQCIEKTPSDYFSECR